MAVLLRETPLCNGVGITVLQGGEDVNKWVVDTVNLIYVRYPAAGSTYVPWVAHPWTDLGGANPSNPQPECSLTGTSGWTAGRKYWVSDCWNLKSNADYIGLVGSMWDTKNR